MGVRTQLALRDLPEGQESWVCWDHPDSKRSFHPLLVPSDMASWESQAGAYKLCNHSLGMWPDGPCQPCPPLSPEQEGQD